MNILTKYTNLPNLLTKSLLAICSGLFSR